MAINYDGRYEVRIFYTVGGGGDALLTHRHTIDVRVNEPSEIVPGNTFDTFFTLHHNGSSAQALDADVDAYVALIQPLLGDTEAEITHAELWEYAAEPSLDAVFISAYPIGLAGTGTPAAQLAGQVTVTWRTALGNVMRTQIMEPAVTNLYAQSSAPFTDAIYGDIEDYLTGLAHPFVGRDDARPIAGIKVSWSQNEKLYRKRYRP